MITSTVPLTATRGDTWLRVIPIEVLTGTGRRPATPEELTDLASRYTTLRLQIREDADSLEVLVDLSSADGELRIAPEAGGVVIEGPAVKMLAFAGGVYDLQLTDPRPGYPLGPLVWTLAGGPVRRLADVTRA